MLDTRLKTKPYYKRPKKPVWSKKEAESAGAAKAAAEAAVCAAKAAAAAQLKHKARAASFCTGLPPLVPLESDFTFNDASDEEAPRDNTPTLPILAGGVSSHRHKLSDRTSHHAACIARKVTKSDI